MRIAVRVITRDRTPTHGYADGDGGVREEKCVFQLGHLTQLLSAAQLGHLTQLVFCEHGLSDVLFMQQIIRKANHGALRGIKKSPFSLCDCL
jgi:hypothetical protein